MRVAGAGPRASGEDTSQLYLVSMGEVGNVRTVEGGADQRSGVEKSSRLARVAPAGNRYVRVPGHTLACHLNFFLSFLYRGRGLTLPPQEERIA